MDLTLIEFGGITVIAMVFGLTQFFKELFNMKGKAVTALAMVIGLAALGGIEALQFLPPEAVPIAEAVYRSIAFGLAAAGFYKYGTRNDG